MVGAVHRHVLRLQTATGASHQDRCPSSVGWVASRQKTQPEYHCSTDVRPRTRAPSDVGPSVPFRSQMRTRPHTDRHPCSARYLPGGTPSPCPAAVEETAPGAASSAPGRPPLPACRTLGTWSSVTAASPGGVGCLTGIIKGIVGLT